MTPKQEESMKSKVTIIYDIEFEVEVEHEPDDDEIEDKACEIVEAKFSGLNHTIYDVTVSVED
jgi:hypothetical protein